MQTIEHINAIRQLVQSWRSQQQHIAFIPTMGNLHAGHLSLIKAAKNVADKVIVSIFVNPMQFSVNEDFGSYPRTLTQDQALLVDLEVDALFTPSVDELLPLPLTQQAYVEVPEITYDLCGKYRPLHFRGVTTIVSKFFNIIQPHSAFFGEKDFQQLLTIQHMVKDLNWPIEIKAIPTMRDTDGLALSSRNSYLSETDRLLAAKLYATLQYLHDTILKTAPEHWHQLLQEQRSTLEQGGFRLDYLELRCRENLQPAHATDQKLIALVAAHIGNVRLIDNIFINLETT